MTAKVKLIDNLARRVYDGDESARDDLYRMGYRFVGWIVRQRGYHMGRMGSWDDIVQEGMLGFWEAVEGWDGVSPFRPWAEMCAVRKMVSAIIKANRVKHLMLSDAVCLDELAPLSLSMKNRGEPVTLMDQLWLLMTKDEPEDIAAILEEREHHSDLRQRIDAVCQHMTELERESLLRLHLHGQSYRTIATALGAHEKAIDNASRRAKLKMRRYWDSPFPLDKRAEEVPELSEMDEAILDVLCAVESAWSSEIADELGRPRDSVRSRCYILVGLGLIESAGIRPHDGRKTKLWRITEAGRRAAISPNPAVWMRRAGA